MSFTASIANFSKTTSKRIEQIRRGVCLKLFEGVIMATPVLTGRLRGNWRASVGSPTIGELSTPDETGKAGAPQNTQTAMSGANLAVGALTGDKTIFLTNSLAYAARIEFDGWSHTKAPAGMVRINVVRFNTLMKVEVK